MTILIAICAILQLTWLIYLVSNKGFRESLFKEWKDTDDNPNNTDNNSNNADNKTYNSN